MLLALAVCLTSCKARKKNNETVNPPVVGANLLETAYANNIKFDLLSAYGQMELNFQGNQIATPFHLRLASDSLLWISIRPFMGVEAVRALIDKDTIRILDKLNKSYTVKPITAFSGIAGVPLDLTTLQSILLGNLPNNWRNYFVEEPNNKQILHINDASVKGMMELNLQIGRPNSWKLHKTDSQDSLQLQYQQYNISQNLLLPTAILVRINQEQSKSEQQIKINFTNFTIEKELNFAFSVPPKYSEIR